ncbi:unnamed protein product [Linum tenue]|uniref:Glycosyltransferase n=1 Tax=Linum tenue TaxID=586396 RepID=A0AAV0QJK4_9ROSI|nr:unnamed protein product [Linum tenue]
MGRTSNTGGSGGHVILLPYPGQGHVNPMIHFARQLASRGLRATLVTTVYLSNAANLGPTIGRSVHHDVISDGFDDTGRNADGGRPLNDYLERMQEVGSKTLSALIDKYKTTTYPVDCVVYEPFLPWPLDVAKEHGLCAAPFFTQPCAVDYVYYNIRQGLLKLPVNSWPVSIPGLPLLYARDVPSFANDPTSDYVDLLGMLVNQFSNTEKADCLLINTFYELEKEVVDIFSRVYPILTIGPTVPSKSNDDDQEYGLDLFRHDASISTDWVATKPPRSVVYVAFGSMAKFTHAQMEELALGLKQTNYYFLWVIRDAEQAKLPQTFLENLGDKALVVSWGPQVKVLASEAVGCFVTHSGWNSTVEALRFGVPMVAMPIWSDQPMNAFLVENVWKVGKRVKADEEGEGNEGIVGRNEVERCVREVMEGESGEEMKRNARKWRDLAVEAVGGGGSSFRNIDEFVAKVMCYSNNRCRSDV